MLKYSKYPKYTRDNFNCESEVAASNRFGCTTNYNKYTSSFEHDSCVLSYWLLPAVNYNSISMRWSPEKQTVKHDKHFILQPTNLNTWVENYAVMA